MMVSWGPSSWRLWKIPSLKTRSASTLGRLLERGELGLERGDLLVGGPLAGSRSPERQVLARVLRVLALLLGRRDRRGARGVLGRLLGRLLRRRLDGHRLPGELRLGDRDPVLDLLDLAREPLLPGRGRRLLLLLEALLLGEELGDLAAEPR